ncbi:MAG: hypothetical protein R2745_17625 [Vicinamibacterales bacterium]
MSRLSRLPDASPRAARAERLRRRCHAELRRRAATDRTRRPPVVVRAAVAAWRPAVALLGAAYFAGVVLLALETYRGH